MALIKLPNTDVIVAVPGTVEILGQQLQRKLTIIRLEYNIENKNIRLEGIIRFYDLEDEEVTTQFIRPYSVKIVADNDMYCDLEGNTLCTVAEEYSDVEVPGTEGEEPTTQKVLNPILEGKNYMTEYEFFYNIAETQPTLVNTLIQQFFTKAILEGRFN